jgi:hypothetical protein
MFSVALCQAASLMKITAFTKYNIRAMDRCNINLNTQDHQASLRLSVLVLYEVNYTCGLILRDSSSGI